MPIDFGATQTSGLNVCPLNRLRKFYGIEEKPLEIFEVIQMLGTVDDEMRKIMGSDVIGLNSMYDSAGCPIKSDSYKNFPMNDGTQALLSSQHEWDVAPNGRTYMYPLGDRSLAPSMLMPEGGYFFGLCNRSPGWDKDNLTPLEDFASTISVSFA
ncbi:MAG TPA: hypothetical protein VM577_21160 [Anaerovoracaceae bacterium]|nr:hypothetical protein [Anaerovoracaceae bacterium]